MPRGIYVRTEEAKRRIREFGQKYGFKKGYTPWNKGGIAWNTGKHWPEKIKRKFSKAHKGKHYSPATEFKKGHKLSEEWKRKMKEKRPYSSRENNPNWKGGRIKSEGYIRIKNREHPCCNVNGYIREHRLIVEAQIERYLLPKEVGHHLGERDDNRPCMLMAFVSNSAHRRFHKDPKNVQPEEIIFDGRKLNQQPRKEK